MFSNKYLNLGCISMIALIFGIVISASFVNTAQAHEQHKKVDLKIKGMDCEHCAKAVESIISKCSGVTGCAVSYKEGKVIVEVEPAEVKVEVVPPSSNVAHSHLKVLYRLRSTAKNCNQKDINAMLIKHNFYGGDKNAKGIFTNNFEPKVVNNDKVIADYFTGLMWHPSGSIAQLG